MAADPKYVGTDRLGFFGVLHTWGRTLEYHPHVHYVVPGGGLSADGRRWLPSRADFLVPAKALSIVFRAKFRDILAREGLLELVDPAVWRRDWVVHSQAAGDGRESLRYLAPYVFRVAIGDHRIVSCDDGKVTFTYRRVGSNRPRKMTLDAMEFLRRFLQHVLPAGFQKVRHYGFLSPNSGTSLEAVRWLITLHNGGVFTLLAMLTAPPARPPRRGARHAAARCPSWDSCRPRCRRSSTRASPMPEVSHFPRLVPLHSRRGRGPVAVRAEVGFTSVAPFAGRSRRRRIARVHALPQRLDGSVTVASDAHSRSAEPALHPSRREALPIVEGSAVSPPGFLNTDWRSGFADSNPSWLGSTTRRRRRTSSRSAIDAGPDGIPAVAGTP